MQTFNSSFTTTRKPSGYKPSGRKSGYVLVTMAAAGFALMGAVGLAIDMGRLYTVKTESQAFTDAAALAAAIQLDGTSAGITAAKAAVTKTNNTWGFNTKTMSTPTVEFSTSSSGTYSTNPGNPAGYIYARVTVSVSAPLAFMPIVMTGTKKYTQTVATRSVAGQISISNFPVGLGPYSAIGQGSMSGPNFGLVVGEQYSIQWPQFNGTRAGCNPGNPEKCFNSPPCAGDSKQAMQAVTQYWGSNNNGYWGFSSNADIKASVLDGLQTQPIAVGDNIYPILSNGNKAAEAAVLDLRVTQDAYYADNSVSNYVASTTHNGRRLMVVPILNPTDSTTTTVLGFGEFLLLSDGTTDSNYYQHETNGNDPFCAIYVGPYVLNADDPGGATSGTGAYRVKLTE